jgi:penicillin amidase
VPAEFAREYAAQATRLLVPRMTSPSADWFGGNPVAARDQLLLSALAAAVAELKGLLGADMGQWKWGALHAATFQHPLATTPEARALLNVGPIPRAGYALTPFNTGGRGFDQSSGSSYRHVMDVQSWDRSVATSAPGQSGQPGSPHYADLAKLWGEHQYFPLSFTEPAVQRNAEATLTLTPGGRVPSR